MRRRPACYCGICNPRSLTGSSRWSAGHRTSSPACQPFTCGGNLFMQSSAVREVDSPPVRWRFPEGGTLSTRTSVETCASSAPPRENRCSTGPPCTMHSRRRGYCAVTQLLMSRRDADRRGLWTVDRAASGSRRRPRGGECAPPPPAAGGRVRARATRGGRQAGTGRDGHACAHPIAACKRLQLYYNRPQVPRTPPAL